MPFPKGSSFFPFLKLPKGIFLFQNCPFPKAHLMQRPLLFDTLEKPFPKFHLLLLDLLLPATDASLLASCFNSFVSFFAPFTTLAVSSRSCFTAWGLTSFLQFRTVFSCANNLQSEVDQPWAPALPFWLNLELAFPKASSKSLWTLATWSLALLAPFSKLPSVCLPLPLLLPPPDPHCL